MEEVGHQLSKQLLDHHLFEVDRHLEGEVVGEMVGELVDSLNDLCIHLRPC